MKKLPWILLATFLLTVLFGPIFVSKEPSPCQIPPCYHSTTSPVEYFMIGNTLSDYSNEVYIGYAEGVMIWVALILLSLLLATVAKRFIGRKKL